MISPKNFIEILRRDNEMYKSAMHQDAHEFLNYLLNTTMESLESYHRPSGAATPTPQNANKLTNGPASERIQPSEDSSLQTESASSAPSEKWVQDLISGTLVSETKCLTCETTSQRDERFLDLSIDLEQNSSLTSCLHKFSAPEMLCERNKFHCDKCGGLQEAEKKTKIKRLPRVLAIHLKRFKWMEEAGRLQKLFHRVAYPNHLRLWNTTSDAEDPDRLYELYAVVVHIGSGPYHGHYVSVIKTPTRGWLLFDDELVEPVAEDFVKNFYGDLPGQACAYVLFYQETTSAGLDEDSAPEVEPTGPIGRQKESGDRTQPEESRLSAFRRGEISGPLKLGGKAAANAKHPFSSIVPPSKVHIFDVSRLERSATTPSRTVGLTAAPEEIIVKSPSAEAVKPEEDSNEVEHLEEAGLPTGRKADVKNGLFKTNPGSRVTSGKGRFKLGSKSRDVQQPAETVDVSEPSTGAAGSTPAPVVAREGRKIHIFGSLRKKASIL